MSETTTTTADEARLADELRARMDVISLCGRILISADERDRIADMLDELANLRAATRWVPVTPQTMPEEQQRVLIVVSGAPEKDRVREALWCYLGYREFGWRTDDTGDEPPDYATHWRPMPDAPPQPQALADDAGKERM